MTPTDRVATCRVRAYLHLRRIKQWLSIFRSFNIMLDGQRIGRIRRGAAREYEIDRGDHELVVTIDWVSSPPVRFHAAPGKHVRYVCGHPSPTWQAAFNPQSLVSAIAVVPDQEAPAWDTPSASPPSFP